MRLHGQLKTWNDDRGFGFIQPQHGNHEIFVHISAFPRDGQRPRVGETLSFEIRTEQDGKKCAIKIARLQPTESRQPARSPARRQSPGSRRTSRLLGATVAIAIGAGALQGYNYYVSEQSDREALSANIADNQRPAPQRPGYRCDGRTYCSQMTSCAEARFFLKNCPGVKMDGNHDGEPCERQWCK
jgi:cold shock CspA family protein